MNESANTAPNRTVMVHTLAAIGFFALIGAGMWLAVYSTRFVPDVVTRLGAAAVSLGSIFIPAPSTSLSVVPTPAASTTISFGEASGSTAPEPEQPKPAAPTAGQKTTTTAQIGGAAAPASLSGLPDLVTTIKAIGYLTASSTDAFVASSTVPAGSRPAVAFVIKNVGTNSTGAWRFSASIPTQSFYLYQSAPQQSLNPGDSIEYTLGFDQAIPGADKMISITANFDHAVTESDTDNNSASAKITVLGG